MDTFFVIVHRKGREERREMRIPPPVPLTEGDKGGGENPHNFSFYSLTALRSRRSLR